MAKRRGVVLGKEGVWSLMHLQRIIKRLGVLDAAR